MESQDVVRPSFADTMLIPCHFSALANAECGTASDRNSSISTQTKENRALSPPFTALMQANEDLDEDSSGALPNVAQAPPNLVVGAVTQGPE